MILDREIYFPYPFHKRVYLFIKKFFYILIRFLGRPTWGRPTAGVRLEIEKHDMVLLVDDSGKVKCESCQSCADNCPTQAISVKGVSGSTPTKFEFNPLQCMFCHRCEEVCPKDALAFIAGEGHVDADKEWIRDLQYLSLRSSLNEGRGLTREELLELRK